MEKKERKSNLVTVRLTADEMISLDYLSDSMDRSKTDVILRACKLFVNLDEPCTIVAEDEKKTKKPIRVHLRMTDTDMDELKNRGSEYGCTISQLIRNAIRSFAKMSNNHY
jgi:hypothetical protein